MLKLGGGVEAGLDCVVSYIVLFKKSNEHKMVFLHQQEQI